MKLLNASASEIQLKTSSIKERKSERNGTNNGCTALISSQGMRMLPEVARSSALLISSGRKIERDSYWFLLGVDTLPSEFLKRLAGGNKKILWECIKVQKRDGGGGKKRVDLLFGVMNIFCFFSQYFCQPILVPKINYKTRQNWQKFYKIKKKNV